MSAEHDMTESTTAATRADYTLQLIADLHAAYGKRVELDITDQGGARWLTLSHSTPTDGTHGLAVGFWDDGTHTMASDGARVELNEATKRDPLAVLVAVRMFLHKYGRGRR
jgi:hypothetical protein